jgi:tRNA(Ile2) C34 agmatinyltransferase TiaS
LSLIIFLAGAAIASAIGVVLYLLRDPSCVRCHHRDWSKGVPPWRCRRCGEALGSVRSRRRHSTAPVARTR